MAEVGVTAGAVVASGKRRRMVRRRPVTFGNPALGTYGGFVDTYEPHGDGGDTIPAIGEEDRLVAMVNVPAEQVPEGILTFCRSHRPHMEHVRIVITSQGKDSLTATHYDMVPIDPDAQETTSPHKTYFGSTLMSSPKADIEETVSVGAVKNQVEGIMARKKHKQLQTVEERLLDGLRRGDSKMDDDDISTATEMTYLVLVGLSCGNAATRFVKDLNGKPFTTLDENITCEVYRVAHVQAEAGVSLVGPFFATSKSAPSPTLASSSSLLEQLPSSPTGTAPVSAEIHNCAVCLERLDLSLNADIVSGNGTTAIPRSSSHLTSSSVITTVCNHSFHIDCLLRWQDSPCPVCRYDHSGLNEALSQCHTCGTTENNYVCLICGVVSCGCGPTSPPPRSSITSFSNTLDTSSDLKYEMVDNITMTGHHSIHPHQVEEPTNLPFRGHARDHYDETLHAYALDTTTQHVWDFAGQGYVHRLIQNAGDGKLVEVNDPTNTTSKERSLNPGLSDAQEGEVVHRKLEGFASQYYTLLKSQLEQQRIYYESRLEEIRREHGIGRNTRHGVGSQKRVGSTADLISAFKQDRNQLEQRCMTLRRKYKKVAEDAAFYKNMNESLEANKAPMKRQILEAQRELAEASDMIHNCLPPLEAQVQNLMLQLDNGNPGISSVTQNGLNDDSKPRARKM